jgi:hypothetical protein
MDVTYSGISFAVVKTNRLEFTPKWSEDGTTYLYTVVALDVEGVLNPGAMSYYDAGGTPTALAGILPSETIVAIRHALTQPRQRLLITSQTGDMLSPTNTVIQSPAEGYTVDLANGPVPGACTVSRFDGGRTWYIHWTCTCTIHECPNESALQLTPLISNRYSREDQVDEAFKSTILTTGTAVFRTDILEATGTVADDYRFLVLPPVPLGFQRRRVNMAVVPSRNMLHYSCTDEERVYDLGDTAATGSFITDIDGTYGASSLTTPEGLPSGQSLGQFFIRITGDKRASNWGMTLRAWQIAAGKIPFTEPNGLIRQVSVTQSLTKREITMSIVYWYSTSIFPVANSIAMDALRLDALFPNQGGVNPSLPWGGGTQGTSQLKLLVAALEDACSGPAIPDCDLLQAGDTPGGAIQCGPTPIVAVTVVDDLPSVPTTIKSPGEPPYNKYQMDTRYYTSRSMLMAPYASPTSQSQGSGGSGDPTVAVFKVAQPTTKVVVTFSAERVGAHCQIPDPYTNNPNFVLLSSDLIPSAPQVAPDGYTLIFCCSGQYTFGALTAVGQGDNLGMGLLPWVAGNFIDYVVDAQNDYLDGLIDGGNENFA